jgi:outer membrane protein assembly factor BamD
MRRNRISAGFLLLLAAALLAACASGNERKKKFAYVERPVEQIYADAAGRLERKRWDEAIELFAEVERQHPYSSWARRAMLMRAFARYQTNDYDEAIKALDQFISLHPGNKDAPYAYYLKAMCYYERITDVGRDQENTTNAVNALNDVIRRYPNTEYARDARLKLDLTFDHLAGKEMYVGRFYLRNLKHIAAINRFKYVVENYQTTNHAPEALYRIVESYLQIGVIEEARAAAAVLGANYPGSYWYEEAYRLFQRNGLMDKDGQPIKIARKETLEPAAGEKGPDLSKARDLPKGPVLSPDEIVPEALPNR